MNPKTLEQLNAEFSKYRIAELDFKLMLTSALTSLGNVAVNLDQGDVVQRKEAAMEFTRQLRELLALMRKENDNMAEWLK